MLAIYPPALLDKYDAELIVSDGGSKDESVDIARRHATKVTVHDGSVRQTIAGGRNKGAEVGTGEVIVFINGDTYPANIDRFFGEVLAFADRAGIYHSTEALACAVDFPAKEKKMSDRVFHAFYNNYVWLLNVVGIGAGRGECQIVRRSVFEEVGGYRANLAAGEDFDLYARIARKGKIRFSWKCKVIESPRRFRKFGYFRVLFSWTINAVSVMVRGRSSSEVWEPVR